MYPNLKLQIWKAGLRQNRLAKSLHIDESAFSRIVNGYREPSAELRQALAELLQCDVHWLFESQETPPGALLQSAEHAGAEE